MKKITDSANRRRKLKRRYASTMLFLLVGAFLLPRLAYASAVNDENIINLTNEIRIDEGLSDLSANQLLAKAAHEKAQAIFKEQSFKHDLGDRKFSSWVKESGYDYKSVGENLAIDFLSSEGAMEAWMSSPSHKKNILNPKFQEIGVAVKEDNFQGHRSLLIVQIFGTPAGTSATSPESLAPADLDQNAPISNEPNASAFLTHSAPRTLLVANTGSSIDIYGQPEYINVDNSLYGLNLPLENLQQAIIYIIDYSSTYLLNYYWTIIFLLLAVFSVSIIREKKRAI
jgi:uncharacterized protein YkwD